eukprot:scaffold77397_cov61-Phaeocystis_antarctica.AAC.10
MRPVGRALSRQKGREAEPLAPSWLGRSESRDLLATKAVARPHLLRHGGAVKGAHQRQTSPCSIEEAAHRAARVARRLCCLAEAGAAGAKADSDAPHRGAAAAEGRHRVVAAPGRDRHPLRKAELLCRLRLQPAAPLTRRDERRQLAEQSIVNELARCLVPCARAWVQQPDARRIGPFHHERACQRKVEVVVRQREVRELLPSGRLPPLEPEQLGGGVAGDDGGFGGGKF